MGLNTSHNIKIILVDDQHEFLEAFSILLDTMEHIKVIGKASNGLEYIDLLKTNVPDIVFMDIEMPGMNGIEATKFTNSNYRGVNIIALSFHREMGKIQEMLHAGARNYLIKDDVDLLSLEQIINNVL